MVVIFLHIPKCAGMSAKFALRNYFGKQNSHSYHEIVENNSSSPKLIDGHLYFGIHERLNEEFCYITFVRDPIRRCVSLWNQLNKSENEKSEYVRSNNFDLYEFIADASPHAIGFYNNQVKRIAGVPEEASCHEYNNEATYLKARENIEHHFAFVGLANRFDEGLVLLKNRLGLSKELVYVRRNVTQKQQALLTVNTLPVRTLELLKEVNKYDLMLYAEAQEKYQSNLKLYPDLEDQVALFKQKNEKYKATNTSLVKGQRNIKLKLSKLKKSILGSKV